MESSKSYGICYKILWWLDEITNTFSDPFDIETGVKQGGHLSSYEYNVLVDNLMQIVTNMNIGAHIGVTNVSIKVYADDILIISPRSKHPQKILDIWDMGKDNG